METREYWCNFLCLKATIEFHVSKINASAKLLFIFQAFNLKHSDIFVTGVVSKEQPSIFVSANHSDPNYMNCEILCSF